MNNLELNPLKKANNALIYKFLQLANEMHTELPTYFCSHLFLLVLLTLVPVIDWSKITIFQVLDYMISSKQLSPVIPEIFLEPIFLHVLCISHDCIHCSNLQNNFEVYNIVNNSKETLERSFYMKVLK